jgi:DHA1 family tetracycline resistance protein-like MFS transporter
VTSEIPARDERQRRPPRTALAFIAGTVAIDTMGFGIILPVLPTLIVELTATGLDAAAEYGGALIALYALMQFLCAPVLGNLSDSYGRRPVLLLGMSGLALDYLVMAFAPGVAWLMIGRAIAGASGATHTTANAYVADVTPPEERAARFGLLGAAWSVGFILGPVIGGLLGELGPRVPFLGAAGLTLLNLVLGLLVLPESLAPDSRRPFRFARANPVGALRQVRRYPVAFGMLGALLLFQIGHDANPSTWTYYTMLKFGWTSADVGYSMAAVGVGLAIVQGGFMRFILAAIGERMAVLAGLATMATAFLGWSIATEGWMMYALIVPYAVGSIAMPAIRGVMSNQVPEDEQGELQGAVMSLLSLTAIGSPLLMTQVFRFFTADAAPVYFPGAPFFAAAVLLTASLASMARALSGEAVSRSRVAS